MATSGANPSVYGYPDPPPPPPRSSGASHNYDVCCVARKISVYVALTIPVIVFYVLVYYMTKEKFPRFQLDSVSVSISVRNTSTAVWDIGFSIDRAAGKDVDVWARFMSRDFRVKSPDGSAGNASVSVSTLFPRGTNNFPGELTLEQVVFQCNNYKNSHYLRYVLKAACKDVTVGISSSKEVILKGGPRLCPLVYSNLIT